MLLVTGPKWRRWTSFLASTFTSTTRGSSGLGSRWVRLSACTVVFYMATSTGRVGLNYAKFLPRDTEWEGSFEVGLLRWRLF